MSKQVQLLVPVASVLVMPGREYTDAHILLVVSENCQDKNTTKPYLPNAGPVKKFLFLQGSGFALQKLIRHQYGHEKNTGKVVFNKKTSTFASRF